MSAIAAAGSVCVTPSAVIAGGCVRSPSCKCCEIGAPCVGVLQLDARQWAQIARVEAAIGRVPRHVELKSGATASRAHREELEPTQVVECPCCDGTYELAEYLAAFLTEHRAPMPRCSHCEFRRRAA